MEWNAIDPQGAQAVYRLEIEVKNVNRGPTIDIDNRPTIIQARESEYSTFDLSNLFADEDIIHGDSLKA